MIEAVELAGRRAGIVGGNGWTFGGGAGGGAGSFIDPFQLLEGHPHIALAHPEKAADRQYHGVDLAGSAEDDVVDVADVFVVVVVDLEADQLGGTPLALLVRIGAGWNDVLGRRGGDERTRQQRRCKNPGHRSLRLVRGSTTGPRGKFPKPKEHPSR